MAKTTLHLHFYFPNVNPQYSAQALVDYLRGGSVDPQTAEQASVPPSDRFDDAGVSLVFQTKALTGAAEFKKSLDDPGSVVVYLGHSTLDFKKKVSLGLSPLGHSTAEIPRDKLMDLLKASKAKLVILATCASSTLGLEKLKAGPAVVVTNSQSDITTWSLNWGQALTPFLLLLIGYEVGKDGQPVARKAGRATIKDALDAGNASFKENKTDDRFELAFGEGSKVVFPSS